MHARIATFEGARPEHVEIVRKHVSEKFLPQARGMSGYAGMIQLTDLGAGRALSVHLFENEEALEASDRELNAMSPPEDLSDTRRASVDKYEVALAQVEGEPAAARLSRLEGPADPHEYVRHATENIVPKARALEGWNGILMLVGPGTQHAVITFWASTDALRASEEQANKLRQDAADAFGETIAGVERYEVIGIEVPVGAGIR